MAWRIDDAVVRGEIDNRERDRVRGRLWFVGRDEPIELDLAGNAWRDVAGRVLHFVNRQPRPRDLAELESNQIGKVGDITAARKAKVPDIAPEEIGEYYRQKKPWPWHWANVLYLEWVSEANGRVVIESADYDLIAVGEAAWEMSEAEEDVQRQVNSRTMLAFIDGLHAAIEPEAFGALEAKPAAAAAEGPPMTEEEAEAWLAREDLLLDRVEARMAREGDAADFELILEEERARLRHELGEPEPEPIEFEDLAGDDELAAWFEEMSDAGLEEAAETSGRMEKHPLVDRATDLFYLLHELNETESWVTPEAQVEHPVRALIEATMGVGPKLAGALAGRRWPPPLDFCAMTIVRLKRVRGYLDDALAATESCREENLIPTERLGPIVVELIDLARDIDALIGELRVRLRGATG